MTDFGAQASPEQRRHRRATLVDRALTMRDRAAYWATVPVLLVAIAVLDLTGVLLTDYRPTSDGHGEGLFWWLIFVWALWRTYRGGTTARRVSRAMHALAFFCVVAVALPGVTAGDGQAWYWYPFLFATQLFALLALTSSEMRQWCSEPGFTQLTRLERSSLGAGPNTPTA